MWRCFLQDLYQQRVYQISCLSERWRWTFTFFNGCFPSSRLWCYCLRGSVVCLKAYNLQKALLFSFRPETVLFRHGGVNLRACLCGIPMYASAQALDFLATTKNSSFPARKRHCVHPEFPDGHYLEIHLFDFTRHCETPSAKFNQC